MHRGVSWAQRLMAAAWWHSGYRSLPQSRVSEEGLVHDCVASAQNRAWNVVSLQTTLLMERTNIKSCWYLPTYWREGSSEIFDINPSFLNLLLFSTTFRATVNTNSGFVLWIPLLLWGSVFSANIFLKHIFFQLSPVNIHLVLFWPIFFLT